MHDRQQPAARLSARARWGALTPAALGAYALALARRAAGQVYPLRRVLVALAVVVGLTLVGMAVLAAATGTPMALLTRDMAATAGVKFYIGALSNLGVLLWAAAATVSLFGAVALRRVDGQQERAGYLGGAALLLTALGADDFFMLHEVVYPKFGLEEEALVLFYGGGLAALLLRYRSVLLDSDVLLLVLGALCFLTERLVDGLVRDATALEDAFKFAGILCWLTYHWRLALAGVRGSRAAPRPDT